MKKLFTLFALAMLPAFAIGQSYFKDGTTWKTLVTSTTTPYGQSSVEVSTLSGQQVVDGYNTLKLYYTNDGNESSTTFIAYIRTDNDKVYFKLADSESEDWRLMYDFGLSVGEGCYVYYLCNGSVNESDKTYIKCTGISDDASGLKVMSLEEYNDETCSFLYGTGKWLKGLASENGLRYNNRFNMDGLGSTLLEAYNGSEVFYSKTVTDIANARPDGLGVRIDGKNLCVSNAGGQEIALYTTDGVRIARTVAAGGTASLTLPGSGMYLLKVGDNVKKVMAK